MTGRSAIRLRISQCHSGRPTKANTKMAMTITQSKNAVPQRGWIKLNFCTFAGVNSTPFSRAWIVLCSAPWYWNTPQVGEQRDHQDVADEDRDADQAFDQDERPGRGRSEASSSGAPARP